MSTRHWVVTLKSYLDAWDLISKPPDPLFNQLNKKSESVPICRSHNTMAIVDVIVIGLVKNSWFHHVVG